MRNWWWMAAAVPGLVAGCSFPPSEPLRGQIVRLEVTPQVASALYLKATVYFTGAVERPRLELLPATDTVQVVAVGGAPQHFMGWGVFPVDRTTLHIEQLASVFAIARPSSGAIQGLLDGALTATCSWPAP